MACLTHLVSEQNAAVVSSGAQATVCPVDLAACVVRQAMLYLLCTHKLQTVSTNTHTHKQQLLLLVSLCCVFLFINRLTGPPGNCTATGTVCPADSTTCCTGECAHGNCECQNQWYRQFAVFQVARRLHARVESRERRAWWLHTCPVLTNCCVMLCYACQPCSGCALTQQSCSDPLDCCSGVCEGRQCKCMLGCRCGQLPLPYCVQLRD